MYLISCITSHLSYLNNILPVHFIYSLYAYSFPGDDIVLRSLKTLKLNYCFKKLIINKT